MTLSLENPVEAGIIDALVNGTWTKDKFKKSPGLTVVSDSPFVVRYQRVDNSSLKKSKPSVVSKK